MKIKKPSLKLAGICRTAFPAYNGRKWRLEAREKKSTLSYWSGGSKDSFVLVNLATGATGALPETNVFGKPPDPTQITPGFALVEHSLFCGKDMGLTCHVHPGDLQALQDGCLLAEIKT